METKKTMDIAEVLVPNNGELQGNAEDGFHAVIADEELDEIECAFNYDNCVEINTESYSYITLSVNDLRTLLNLTMEAERRYAKELK